MASLQRAASRAAFLAAAVNLAAAIVMLAILRPGLPAGESSLVARAAHVHANAAAWRAGWLVWNVAALALLALFVALSLLWREHAPVLCRLAVLAAAAGVAADIGAESIFMTVSPRLDGEQFALVEAIAVGLTGFVGNGLYTVAGILLTWAGRRALPRPLLVLGAAVWASGLTLSAATLVDSDRAQLLSAGVLMPLFVMWAALVGRSLHGRSAGG